MKLFKTTTLATLLLSSFLHAQGSFIPYTSEANATGEVKKIYEEVKAGFGIIPAPIMQHSVSRESLGLF